ncbi:MAG: DUF4878 domain-containing protein [Bacteroidales bacterium]|nr:DUF4878 domain-containing protein [Bacteroidales bacterium]
MKTKTIYFLLVAVCVLLTGCNREQRKVEVIAQNYLTDMGNYRFEEAKKYAAEEQLPMIEKAAEIVKDIPEENLQQVLPVTITLKDINIENDSAFVVFESKSKAFQNKGMLKMVKQEGEWKACQQKRIEDYTPTNE